MKHCKRDDTVTIHCVTHDSYFTDERVTMCRRAERQLEGIAQGIVTRAQIRGEAKHKSPSSDKKKKSKAREKL